MICHDPDAPLVKEGSYGFVHWVLYNLPGDITSLDENTTLGTLGMADFGKPGYGGPMPQKATAATFTISGCWRWMNKQCCRKDLRCLNY
ncbi:hypothetical protein HAALTHF_43910n [Vreelandella aquamarina]|nr:hypothetical protein HAALTHF_43910n [Halomonas axialensis]